MVELERDRQKVFIAFGAVFPPNQEGIVKDTTVHIDYAVNIVLNKAGCANDHAIGDLMIFTPLLHPPRQFQIARVKRIQII